MKRFSYIVALLFIFGCSGNNSSFVDISSAKKVSVNLRDIDNSCSIRAFFSAIELIQLDTNNNSFLRPEGIYRCAFSGDSIFVLNKGEDVFLFLSNGASIGPLQKKGRGPGEYIFPSDILVNTYNNSLDVLEGSGKIVSYSLSSLELERVLYLPEEGYPYDSFEMIDEDKYLLSSRGEFRIALFDVTQKRLIFSNYSFPSWLAYSYFTYRNCFSPFIQSDNDYMYFEGWSGTVYKIDSYSMNVYPFIRWDMGINQFEVKRLKPDKDAFYYYNEYLRNKDNYATPFTNIVQNNQRLFVNFLYKDQYHTLVYDIISEEHSIIKRTTEKIPIPVGHYYNNSMYEFVRPDLIDSLITRNVLDENSQKIYDGIREDSNLLIIKYTFND